MKRVTALITGGGSLLGQGIVQSLLRSPNADCFDLASCDPSERAPTRNWVNRFYRCEMATSPTYIRTIIDIAKEISADIIIPGTDVELLQLSEHKEALDKLGIKALVSDPHTIEIADDKYKTFLFLQSNNLNPPRTAIAEDAEEFTKRVRPPYIIKPRVGARSYGVEYITDTSKALEKMEQGENLVIQECIGTANDEFSAGYVSLANGEDQCIILSRTLKDGNTHTASYHENQSHLNHIRLAGRALGPMGPCNFQYRIDSGGNPRIFEINARFSGTTVLRSHLGFREVEWCIFDALNCQDRILIPNKYESFDFIRYLDYTYFLSS